jgi:predicted tellurium resistance membrane protein TerC
MEWDWIAPLVTLTAMEIVLGIDNVIFIAILVQRLPQEQQAKARQLGIGLALVMRLGLLFTLSWIMSLEQALFRWTDLGAPEAWFKDHPEVNAVTWRDIILLGGGLFLIAKSTYELHEKLEGAHGPAHTASGRHASFAGTLAQIMIIDIVFSLDSVITAVGMARRDQIWVMVTAMVIAVGVMLIFAGAVSRFVHKHPTLKILALSFLILIGVLLVAEGTGAHLPRGYLYFAMAFSLVVEMMNIRVRKVSESVRLHEPPPVKS